jgi:hypothetical protein
MLHHYEDIRSRIAEPPRWWDEDGVPRYCAFGPDEVSDIYADEAMLFEIACQSCKTLFLVAGSRGAMGRFHNDRGSLADEIRRGTIHYGDPPNVGCCPAGATMNCDDLRVVEYWQRMTDPFDWQRDGSLEIAMAGLAVQDGGE